MRIALALALSLLAACAPSATAPTGTPSGSPTAPATFAATQPPAPIQAATTPDCAAPAQPLVELTEGPYYRANPPERTSLVTDGVVGTQLLLSGFVVTRSCRPLAGARLDFWQADGNGTYDNTGYNLRGYQLTDAAGRYNLRTVIPGLYPGRTQHIHFKVTASGQTWTSQLFFPDSSGNARDSIYSERMLVKLDKSTNPVSGTFTFVVNIP